MAGTERQRLTAAAGQHDGRRRKPHDLNAGDRPGIGPGPWFDRVPACERLDEGTLEQKLGEPRLGVDPQRLAAQHETDDQKDERRCKEAASRKGDTLRLAR